MRGLHHILAAILVLTAAPAVAADPLPESPGMDIGYKSVAEALTDLKARPGMQVSSQNGWTIVVDEATHSIWSFAPADDPSYPSAVKRQVVQQGTSVVLDMKVLCEASKAACDDLVRTFQQMNGALTGDAAR